MTPGSVALLAALALLALTGSSAGADDDGARTVNAASLSDDASEPSAALSTWGSFRIGVVDAPYYSPTLREVRSDAGQARLFRFGGAVRVASATWIGAHAAYALAGIEQPAGSYRAAKTWGNPILFAESSRAELADSVAPGLVGRVRLSMGLPLAERGQREQQLDRRALVIADALEGMSEPELFTPEALPLVAAGSLVLHRDRLLMSLGLKIPLLVRLSDESVPDGAATSALAFTPSCEARVTLWPWTWLGTSLGSTLAWPLVRPVYLSERHGPPQAMVVPRLLFAIGSNVLIALDVDLAAGGPLSGTASAALGARLAVE